MSQNVAVKLVEVPKSVDEIKAELEAALAHRYQMGNGVKREGKEIVVPPHMTLLDAAAAITNFQNEMEEEEETMVELYAHPYDCCNAFYRAVSEVYGTMTSDKNMGFFGPNPGKCLAVPVSHKESIKVPIGNAKVPGLNIGLTLSVEDPTEWSPGERGSMIVFRHKKKYTPLIQDIEAHTKKILTEESIFQGKAIDSKYTFINIESFDRSKVIYSKDQERQLDANIFTIIKQTDRAIAANIPIKRGILLHGPYGTGKTLTALNAASLCVENGWTFILVRPDDDIDDAINMAQKLQPALVFFEDIDAAAGEERDDNVNSILNTIDGALSKDSQVMVILTTNHIERINPAMLRPGRLDAVIRLGELDKEGVVRFIKEAAMDKSGQMMLDDELDEDAVFEAAKGYVPAFLKEGVSKATLYAIARGAYNGKSAHICSDDIVAAFNELRPQYDLMVGPREAKKVTLEDTVRETAERAIAETIPTLELHDNGHRVGTYRIAQGEKQG